MAITFTKRIKIARQFEVWCEKNGARICAQAMMTFLDIIDVLDTEKVDRYLKTIKKDNLSYTGIKKFGSSVEEPKKGTGKKK